MIHIYNTMTGRKEPLRPLKDKVHMYVCGVTVYDLCHIGHARSAVAFDVARRAIEWSGTPVVFVKNFTDIDDKIIRKANETGRDWKEITKEFIQAHDDDMGAIGILAPSFAPKATDYIKEMIGFIESLITKGHAYASNGDVYFKVDSFAPYGKLSKRNIDDLQAGARVDINEQKANPLDFALWKAAKPGEPSWPSPWGEGRPGWHIECSVMSESILGTPIDIHGGGQDLVFPHHENEIAQSEAKCGCEFANVWMHNGFVNINKEKMSKSLNNFLTIRDILKDFDPEVLRFFLLTTQYRQPLEYADTKLFETESSLERIYTFKDELEHAISSKKGADAAKDIDEASAEFMKHFTEAMEDDFNTPAALAALFDVIRAFNKILMGKVNADSLEQLKAASEKVFSTVNTVLGVGYRSSKEWFEANLTMPEAELQGFIAARKQARVDKDFAKADQIRQELAAKGIELLDTPEGTRYRTRKIRS
ncbi:MAG: cysteine--tRNA ligase [Deferribacteraceae bacterium]|jgi:cysteinyl-tRNA synthetase|nr:cysteine--tRNA ligase [Deferribacteraceae bacterium]